MFQKLASHNPDLQKLADKGYAVGFDNTNHLVVRDIPYLNEKLELKWGAIVAKVEFIDQNLVKQTDHQIFFAGSAPYGIDGKLIPNLSGGPTSITLSEASEDVKVERSFSNKPKATGEFPDFFDKVESYVTIISGPAIELHGANPYTFRQVEEGKPDSIFKFNDTMTSRAGINDLAMKMEEEVVAVIGLGGTGSYILDFLAKTRVREIKGFDADNFHIHNSYRSPGRVHADEFGKSKAEVHQSRHSNFRHGLTLETKKIDENSADDLSGVTFAFICVDKGSSRSAIIDLLISLKIPFIDVGMGLSRKHGPLNGMVRVTYFPPERAKELRDSGIVELEDVPENIYRLNIQIGELNALNACLAVIKFKQLHGFYAEEQPYSQILFKLGDLKSYGE